MIISECDVDATVSIGPSLCRSVSVAGTVADLSVTFIEKKA